MLLTGCETAGSDIVIVETPTLFEYSDDVQALAADEMESLGPPCPRSEVVDGCSAVKTFVKDYQKGRDEIRAAKKN